MQRYLKAVEDKKSRLCVGLDPALGEQRNDDVIAERYGDDMLGYCLDIINATSMHAAAFKINSQYVLFKLTVKELFKLNNAIKDEGCLSILDHKLGDIKESNQSAFYWIQKAGFDAVTYSPYPGNIKEAVIEAHQKNIGLFTLVLMSNPQARWIQKDAPGDYPPLYERISREATRAKSDGLVVGSTDNVRNLDLKRIKSSSRDDMIYLCPGLGKQKGSIDNIKKILGDNLLVNVGRSIIYDKHPGDKADEYKKIIQK